MTRIFIHIEALLYTPHKPYRLSACSLDRSRVFESNILWPDTEIQSDEISRMLAPGHRTGTSDGSVEQCYGTAAYVADCFMLWLEECGGRNATELWVKSHQEAWREMNALGLHVLPVFDLSTFVRISGRDFALESVIANRDALGKAGAVSPRVGAYEAAILFNNVCNKTLILK